MPGAVRSPLVEAASGLATVGRAFTERARLAGETPAIYEGERSLSYRQLAARVNRLANALAADGIGRGERVAVLSENRREYIEVQLACAKIGAVAACQNWRQIEGELTATIGLVSPAIIFVSPRFAPVLERCALPALRRVSFGEPFEALLAGADETEPEAVVDTEDGLLILYTSGTTGAAKGAVVSHRAMLARGLVMTLDWRLDKADAFPAWAPLFHMASADLALATLCHGGAVVVIDGFDAAALTDAIGKFRLSWLILMPGMIARLLDEVRRRGVVPRGIRLIGCMANLVPPHQIAEATRILNSPYLNSIGSTETGTAPASATLIPVGTVPSSFSKAQTALCEVRLVDEDDREVPDGEVGEMALRGPTLFSGYWNAPDVNAHEFRHGWFHTGDSFVRNPDGTLDFVDRRKYLIKSGGENIYPAEIERVLLASPRITSVAVVRRPDGHWGEVPVAYVAASDPTLTADEVRALCRAALAGYKVPRAITFVSDEDLPRNTTGKIDRALLERRALAEVSQ